MSAAVSARPVFAVSEGTLKLLKNFASISDSVLLVEGKKQKTVLQSRAVFAIAEFPEAWPRETGIYALGQFLSDISEYEKPTIDFKDDVMVFSDTGGGRHKTYYRYSDPSTIMAIGDKTFPKDNPSVEFSLSAYDLSKLKRHTNNLALGSFNIAVKDGGVIIAAADAKNSASHGFRLEIPKTEVTLHDKSFSRTIPFKVEHLNLLLDGDYIVALSDWRYAYLTNQKAPVSYYVTEQTKND
jgi:hypothetical protein